MAKIMIADLSGYALKEVRADGVTTSILPDRDAVLVELVKFIQQGATLHILPDGRLLLVIS